jgi:hypothetical protein
MNRLIWALCAAICLPLCAQEGAPVNVSEGPPIIGYTQLYFYDGSNNLEYVCSAKSLQPEFQWLRSDTTLTSIVDSSNTSTITTSSAHGLSVGNLITIRGATVDADLNGTYYVQSVNSSTTFTITTSNVTDATYNESTLVISTNAPRSTANIWSILKISYNGTNMIRKQRSVGNAACDNRATTTGNSKVTYN